MSSKEWSWWEVLSCQYSSMCPKKQEERIEEQSDEGEFISSQDFLNTSQLYRTKDEAISTNDFWMNRTGIFIDWYSLAQR